MTEDISNACLTKSSWSETVSLEQYPDSKTTVTKTILNKLVFNNREGHLSKCLSLCANPTK